jgi:hypothetical protein
MEISSLNGRNQDMRIFVACDVFKQETRTSELTAFVEFQNQNLKKEKLSNVFTADVEDALDE